MILTQLVFFEFFDGASAVGLTWTPVTQPEFCANTWTDETVNIGVWSALTRSTEPTWTVDDPVPCASI